jgi:hypothetical protein
VSLAHTRAHATGLRLFEKLDRRKFRPQGFACIENIDCIESMCIDFNAFNAATEFDLNIF